MPELLACLWRRAAALLSLIITLSSVGALAAAAERPIEFNRDIRPLLAEYCLACHGPDSANRKADLRLDQRQAAIDAGAIVPGNEKASELIARVLSGDPEQVMPPADTTKKLSPAQKDLLRRWVASGAEYQVHWSFIPPRRPALPAVKQTDWVRTPIDRLVLARLEAAGLKPAPEADRRTLARRLSLDLTGLPPEPADVDAFVADTSTDAYEKYVDRLLESPAWGEHRGRYWLDAARYADTHGIHFDNMREMWSYRQWVIEAFNRNLPFDRFTVEQLAGDLLPTPTLDQRIATGFNRCNITTNEGGIIDEEYAVLYTRDRTETTSQVWMGLTAGCAVCHDHKFDPLSQREFYELAAFFNNTTQATRDGNIKDTPPVVVVPTEEDEARWSALQGELAALQGKVDANRTVARKVFDKNWLPTARTSSIAGHLPHDGLQFHALCSEGVGNTLHAAVEGQMRALALAKPLQWQPGHVADKGLRTSKDQPIDVDDVGGFDTKDAFSFGAWVRIPGARQTGALLSRMSEKDHFQGWDLYIDEGVRFGVHFVAKWEEDGIKLQSNTQLKPNDWAHLFVTYDGSGKAAGINMYLNGLPAASKVTTKNTVLKGSIKANVPMALGRRHSTWPIDGAVLNDIRVYSRALKATEVEQLARGTRSLAVVAKAADKRTQAELGELFDWWFNQFDATSRQLGAELAKLRGEEAQIKGRGTVAHVMNEKGEAPMAYILYRGDYDKRRDEVNADTPDILPAMDSELPRNRLGLAQWLLDADHPLTTRVTVNRFWQEVFGAGLVRTAGDFGATGELPSHPELLDWLAVEFRESSWDVKRFFKLLVTSATYRQSAVADKLKLEKDPANRLLSRGPRFRMDGEMLRDYALASSGLLVRKLGGPSVKPYQPDGVWEAVAMIGSNTRDYKADKGEGLYRRSMYTFWKRSAPPASMDIFNAPSREICCVRRERTNTPLQALVTLNDPQFVESARHLAQRAVLEAGSAAGANASTDDAAADDARVDFIARRLMARSLRPAELEIVKKSLAQLRAYYQAHADDAQALVAFGDSPAEAKVDAVQLAAWTMLVNEMLNLDEVLTK
ncbi:MAG: DUF1553 domain-containing protein [Planctomycetes bacterium]|nr:DUF1553 domain-containing protein [Planctomycetota bacterium]